MGGKERLAVKLLTLTCLAGKFVGISRKQSGYFDTKGFGDSMYE